jgi:hypothetical protein
MADDDATPQGLTEHAAFNRAVWDGYSDEYQARHDARFPGRPMVVSTGRDNAPARRRYALRGFGLVREREVVPGLWIAELARPPRPGQNDGVMGRG